MKSVFIPVIVTAAAIAVIAGVAFAQILDSQSASGTITATSTSADIYLCEAEALPGPSCGSDDNGADETIFEGIEDIRAGETVWDVVRVQNVGTDDVYVWNTSLTQTETSDPGADCDRTLASGIDPVTGISSRIFIMTDGGDDDQLSGAPEYPVWGQNTSFQTITIAPGGYEDVVIAYHFQFGTDGDCTANEWLMDFEFSAQ